MKKINSKKGFTLAELLIVVAIIAILVAISIPIFTLQLEKSRESTDLANIRAAKAAAAVVILDGSTDSTIYKALVGTEGTCYYDADAGQLTTTKPSFLYGKGTTTVGDSNNKAYGYTAETDAAGKVLKVSYSTDKQTFTFEWV